MAKMNSTDEPPLTDPLMDELGQYENKGYPEITLFIVPPAGRYRA